MDIDRLAISAYHLGRALGEAIHCHEPEASHYGVLAGRWIARHAGSAADWEQAVRVYATAAWVLNDTGPIDGTCAESRRRFDRFYTRLRESPSR